MSNAPRDAVCAQFDFCTESTGSPTGPPLLLAAMLPCADHGGMYSKASRQFVSRPRVVMMCGEWSAGGCWKSGA